VTRNPPMLGVAVILAIAFWVGVVVTLLVVN
jgi:hypothetical protein